MESKGTSRMHTARLRKCADLLRFFRREDEGATLVEMALASAILFASLFGVIMISFALYTYNYVAEAAHAGARYAIVRGAWCVSFPECTASGGGPGAGNADITTFVQSLNYPGVDTTKLHVNTHWYYVVQDTTLPTVISLCGTGTSPAGCNVPGYNAVQVQVSYDFPLNVPFWRSTTLTMASSSQLVISQ